MEFTKKLIHISFYEIIDLTKKIILFKILNWLVDNFGPTCF